MIPESPVRIQNSQTSTRRHMMDKVSPVTINFHQKEVSGRYLIISLFTTYIMFLYEMVDHFTMRTYGVNQTFRFVLNAFGYIERVVISEFFFGKDQFCIIRAKHVLSYHLI